MYKKIGNIGNPIVNRLGRNVFWQHFWYSKLKYNENPHRINLILKLLFLYLKFGLNLTKNIFFSTQWFLPSEKNKNTQHYYRWSFFYNNLSGGYTRHRFRIQSDTVYKTRASVLMYNNWLVVIIQWFEPDKYLRNRVTKLKQVNFINNYILKKKKKNPHTKVPFDT